MTLKNAIQCRYEILFLYGLHGYHVVKKCLFFIYIYTYCFIFCSFLCFVIRVNLVIPLHSWSSCFCSALLFLYFDLNWLPFEPAAQLSCWYFLVCSLMLGPVFPVSCCLLCLLNLLEHTSGNFLRKASCAVKFFKLLLVWKCLLSYLIVWQILDF